MISSDSAKRFLVVSRFKTQSGIQEKVQYWDSRKTKKMTLPFATSISEEDGALCFLDSVTGADLKQVSLHGFSELEGGIRIELSDSFEVQILQPLDIPAAHQDETPKSALDFESMSLGLFVYEGSGACLDHFQRIGKVWISSHFTLDVTQDSVTVSPFDGNELKLNGVRVGSPVRLGLKDLADADLRSGGKWWKLGCFPASIILDDSQYEEVDPAEARLDQMFKAFIGVSVAAGALVLGMITSSAPSKDLRPVLETTEIKIDRSGLNAKAIEEELKSPVAMATPVPPVEVPGIPVPKKGVARPQANSPGPSAQKVIAKAPLKTQAQPRSQVSAGNVPNAPRAPSAPSASAALLTRHSKMLQDAFGSVMAMQTDGAKDSVAPAVGGGAPSVNGPALGKGSGLFNTGTGRGIASDSVSGNTGGVAGNLVKGANPQQFVKVVSGGPLGAGASGGYSGGSGKIEVMGQGKGGGGMASGYGGGGGAGATLTHAEVAGVFQKHVSEIRMCYESAMLSHPDLQGTISLAFEIQANGSVRAARVKESDLGKRSPASAQDSLLSDCLLKRVSSWAFPKPRDGKKVDILSYPLVFKSLGGGND